MRARSQTPLPWLAGRLRLVLALASLPFILTGGCRKGASSDPGTSDEKEGPRRVMVVTPERKTIRREVGQPGVIHAFERTPIVSRIAGYILKWNYDLDIGAPVHEGDVLAELWVPEMHSELKLKEEMVEQATKSLSIAESQIETAKAQVREAEAAVGRSDASRDYWKSQSERFTSLVKDSVLDKQTQEETVNQYRAALAALAEAQAKVASAKALEQEKERARDKAKVDVRVADAERQRQADLVGYATLKAPYDGMVTQRNINTKQFVQPAVGGQGDVLYVVERTDIVRIFVSVPETDAGWVHVGTPATVRVQALQGQEFPGKVTRTAWSLNNVTRTLRTEIDLANPELPKVGRRLRPGMYAYATLQAEWRDVLTLPASAVVAEGDVNVGYKHFCYIVDSGHVRRTRIEIGARNEELVEVLKKQVPATQGNSNWVAWTETETVVQGDLSGLRDGQAVEAIPPKK